MPGALDRAVRQEHFAAAAADARVGFHDRNQLLKPVLVDHRIVVQETDVLAPGTLDP